jgi:hypothetical protein
MYLKKGWKKFTRAHSDISSSYTLNTKAMTCSTWRCSTAQCAGSTTTRTSIEAGTRRMRLKPYILFISLGFSSSLLFFSYSFHLQISVLISLDRGVLYFLLYKNKLSQYIWIYIYICMPSKSNKGIASIWFVYISFCLVNFYDTITCLIKY